METESKTPKRLRVLEDDEIEAIYARPAFTEEEQKTYLSFSPQELAFFSLFRTIKSRLFFLLQFGYFKAKRLFFIFCIDEVESDARYIQKAYFPNFTLSGFKLAKGTRLKQQKIILDLFTYRYCDAEQRDRLEEKAKELVRISCKPIYIFRGLLEFLTQQRIILPGYSLMQDTIGQALTHEQSRLTELSERLVTEATKEALNRLLENPDGLYEVTRLKREPKDFSAKEITAELARGEQLRALYLVAERLLSMLEISNESVKYYASLINYYSVFRLHQLERRLVNIYLLCFVFHRYQRFHDNLISCFLFRCKRLIDEAKSAAKEAIYQQRLDTHRDLRRAGGILGLFLDEEIPEETSYRELKRQAFEILEAPKLAAVVAHIAQSSEFDETALQWEHIDEVEGQFKRRLRPLVRRLTFSSNSSTSSNFLRLETLQKANERVSNTISRLPIFRHYQLGDAIHSSSDGQKFETTIHTINARYSPKYFGLKKGIVSYTLVANYIPINARIIGANEHESHYVFDLLFNNTTEIQPAIHSTDTHGTNEINFALLHLFGYQFAPRYRKLQEKVANGLYGFQHPTQYDEEWLLKPRRKLRTRLIIEEWENIQRIIASLALKTTTQSIIVGKLSSYVRKNRTRQTLWEYDNIIRSIYLLDYIDSLSLRRNVQHALNRGENYHQLRRAVSYANFGKLRFKTEHEQQIWNECSRLLTNCIILYNTQILSKLLELKEERGELEEVEGLKRISPVAWQHINFFGRYEFTKASEPIDLDALVHQLLTNALK